MRNLTIVAIIAAVLGGCAGVLLALPSCSAVGPSCAVIDVAHAACDLVPVQYRASDGTIRTEQVPREDIVAAAQLAASRRLDGGAE